MIFGASRHLLSIVLVTAVFGILKAQSRPTLLVDVDHRTTLALNGWHIIVDPSGSGIYDFHQMVKKNGYFMNGQPQQNGGLIEYNVEKSPSLRVLQDAYVHRTLGKTE